MSRFYLIGQAHLLSNTKEADDLALANLHKSRIILENILTQGRAFHVKKVRKRQIILRYLSLNLDQDPENVEEQKLPMRKEFFRPNVFDHSEARELKEVWLEIYNKVSITCAGAAA